MSQSRDADQTQHILPRRRSRASILDVWLTLAMITGAVLAMGYFIAGMPVEARPVLLLAGTTALVLGWGAGILLSPYGGRNQLSSRGTGRLLTGVIIGFVIAWFWQPIKQLVAGGGAQVGDFLSSGLFPVAAISLIIFLLAMISTYVLRAINQN